MSLATVYGTAQFGLASEVSATGLAAASVSFSGSASEAEVPDHIGCVVGFSVFNPMKEVTVSGIISTKSTGLGEDIGSTITLANTTNNTRTRLSEGLGVTPVSGASVIVTSNNIAPTAKGFEEGEIGGKYYPYLAAGTVATLS